MALDHQMPGSAPRRRAGGRSTRFRTLIAGAVVAAVCCGIALMPVNADAAQRPPERITPLLMGVHDAPTPFRGSDGRTHLVYELQITNFTAAQSVLQRAQVLDGRGRVIATLGPKAIAGRLQPAGERVSRRTLAPSTTALLFIHVRLKAGARVPARLQHRVTGVFAAAPPGQRRITETGGDVTVARQPVATFAPPLRGRGYISADSCCDATRHTRAALPVNGRVWIAQRFAVDWEQLHPDGRIYIGERTDPTSYAIYGRPVYAVADSTVASTITGLPDQVPGAFPTNIPIEEADGNSIVLRLGPNRYVLYAHLKPGSVRVSPGQRVKRGDVIAHVGNSGNSVAPHLHAHVMNGPSPLASNGLPYRLDRFTITARTAGTAAFDRAEGEGIVLQTHPLSPPRTVRSALPLDQLIIDFDD